jgi:hypothetical protein
MREVAEAASMIRKRESVIKDDDDNEDEDEDETSVGKEII